MDDLFGAVMSRIVSVLREISARLQSEVATLAANLDTTGGVLDSTKYNLSNLVEIRRQVAAVAEREGLSDIVTALRRELPEVVRLVLAEYDMDLGAFKADITRELVAVLQGQEQEIAQAIVKGTSSEVERAMRHAMTGALDVAELQSRVAQALNTSLGRAAVTIDRAVREVGDRALVAAGEAASEALGDDEFVYIYEGPDDVATRPYCDARVGKYLTLEQAQALEPRKRFRCRHVPAPKLLSEAIAEGIQPFGG